MVLPAWDDSYETGDPIIDSQHRDLLDLVEDLAETDLVSADPGTILPFLDRVMDFTLMHFDMEEALMTRVGYPHDDHVEMTNQHIEFVSYARLRVLEFRFGEAGDLGDFAPYLHHWLTDHEFGLDRKLVAFIRASGTVR